MKRSFIIAALAVVSLTVWAQNNAILPCHADMVTQSLADADPGYRDALANDHLNALQNLSTTTRGNRVVYSIPIVFHVVYNNANENVPNSAIYAQLETLNRDFRRMNADTATPRSLFTHLGEDVEIEFCLAKRDPDNFSVVGITRTQTNKADWNSDIETNDMKQSIKGGKDPWDPSKYLNVWIVDLAVNQSNGGTTAGYAYLGNSGIHGSSIDGIVLDYAIGFGGSSRSLTHEVGHYLGLRHTWGNSNNCSSDDGFSDTPSSDGPKFGCNLNSASCSSTDMIENYMDYADCSNMFTSEQAQYMRYVLQTYRPSLLSSDGCNAYPNAGFTTRFTNVCTGTFVQFEDTTFNDPDTWQWSFPGGTPSTSTLQNPVVYYDTPGTYDVTLQVMNQYGLDIDAKTNYLTVGIGGTTVILDEDFENPLTGWNILNPDNTITWSSQNVTGFNGSKAMGIALYNYATTGERDALVSPLVDLSSVTNTNFTLDYAYRQYNVSNNDSLIISLSTDGGVTYPNVLFADGGSSLATNGLITTSFIPTDLGDWCSTSCLDIDLSAFDGENAVRVKIEAFNGYGNNIYIDNFLITGACTAAGTNTQPPVAIFSTDNAVGCGSTEVNFSDESLYGATSWQWIFPGGNPPQSSDTNPSVTYFTQGSYDVTLTVINANGTDTKVVTDAVTITNELVLNVDSIKPACYGSSNGAVLLDIVGGTPNYSYSWSNGATGSQLSNVEGGIYDVTITDANGCTATAQGEVYNIQGLQLQYSSTGDARPSTDAPRGSVNMFVVEGTGVAPYAYTWSNGATSAGISGLEGGEYTVTVTDANGCEAVETITVVSYVGVNDKNIDLIGKIYPNPVNDKLYVDLSEVELNTAVMTIYDVTGNVVFKEKLNERSFVINVADWASGAYLVQVTDGSTLSTERFIKN